MSALCCEYSSKYEQKYQKQMNKKEKSGGGAKEGGTQWERGRKRGKKEEGEAGEQELQADFIMLGWKF